MLEIKDLVLAAGCEPLSHEFADGELSVVLGRNHSGKTRLARVLAGLEAPVAGRILLDGCDITAHAPGARSVALVYQAFVNYPNLTVAQNIASPLRARGLPVQPRVTELARLVGLEGLLDRHPEQLSGGQQQRVAIARALAKEPRLLVLDEPLVNLDLKLREAFALELRQLLARSGATVIYNSSDPKEAFALGEQVLLLRDHELLQAGAPLDVYRAPTNIQAAHLMSEPGVNPWREAEHTRAVRPEQLRLQRQSASDLAFDVHLLHVESSGQETFLHLQHPSGEHWVARLPGAYGALREDHSLTVFAPQQAVMRFAADGSVSGG